MADYVCVHMQGASPGDGYGMAGGLEPGHPAKGAEPVWQKKNEEVMEKEFQKDLEVHVTTDTNLECTCTCISTCTCILLYTGTYTLEGTCTCTCVTFDSIVVRGRTCTCTCGYNVCSL